MNEFELDWLKRWALYAPQSIAFQDAESGDAYTYSQLFALSKKLAGHLQNEFHVVAGDRVAVLASNELEFIPLFFAVQRLGAVLVPIGFRLTGREIAHILADSEPKVLIFQDQFRSVLESAFVSFQPQSVWNFASGLQQFLASGAGGPQVEEFSAQPQDPCMILYTSGTTGLPKGAMITSAMLHWNSVNTGLRLNLHQHDVSVSFLPFSHTGGWNVLVTPFLHRGARTILLRKFDPALILRICEQERVTILFGIPTTMEMLARSPAFAATDLRSLRFAVVGGEPMSIDLIHTWQRKGVPIRQGYGLTEFGPNVFSLNEQDSIRKAGSIGFANFYVQTRIVDDVGRDVRDGEIGELLLKGPMCSPGYWRNPEATAKTIIDGWLHTGDLVKRDEEGYFYVAGRKKDMFISGGENVYPVEIERFISTHPAIREVAVIGIPDSRWGEAGLAYVSLKSGEKACEEELLAFCQSGLAKFKIPKSIEFMDELPKGASGKILKRSLVELGI